MSELLPWHAEQWSLVSAQRSQGHVPHGLLVHGREGLGKLGFARLLARSLLCEAPAGSGEACERCRSCHLFGSGAHPDFMQVGLLEERKEILIEQVRDLNRFVALTRGQSARKVALIAPAERLNRNAANSLLKTLEEPPPDTLLMLVSHAPALLPATVRSRCQRLAFGTPPEGAALLWLRGRLGADAETLLHLANGSPLKALGLAEADAISRRSTVLEQVNGLVSGQAEPTTVAEEWLRLGFADAIAWTYDVVTDLIRLKFSPEPPDMVNRDVAGDLRALSQRLEFGLLFQLLDKCMEARRVLERHLNLNAQLLLEDLAMTWTGSK